MSSRIRFHLDEQVKSVIARELCRRGIDVFHEFSKRYNPDLFKKSGL